MSFICTQVICFLQPTTQKPSSRFLHSLSCFLPTLSRMGSTCPLENKASFRDLKNFPGSAGQGSRGTGGGLAPACSACCMAGVPLPALPSMPRLPWHGYAANAMARHGSTRTVRSSIRWFSELSRHSKLMVISSSSGGFSQLRSM